MAKLKAFGCPCAGLAQRLSERCACRCDGARTMPFHKNNLCDVGLRGQGRDAIRLRSVLAFRKRNFQQQSRQTHLLSFGTAKVRPCDSDFHIFQHDRLSLCLAVARTRLKIHSQPIGTSFSVSVQGALCPHRCSIFPIARSLLFQTRRVRASWRAALLLLGITISPRHLTI